MQPGFGLSCAGRIVPVEKGPAIRPASPLLRPYPRCGRPAPEKGRRLAGKPVYRKAAVPPASAAAGAGGKEAAAGPICAPAGPSVATSCGDEFRPTSHLLHDPHNIIRISANPFVSFLPLSASPVSVRMKTFCLLLPDRFNRDNLFFGTVHSSYGAVAAASGHGKEFAHITPPLSRFSMG